MARSHPIPGPLCLWRYLIGAAALSFLFLLVVFVKAVVLHERGKYFSALLYGWIALAMALYFVEDRYVEWKERNGKTTQGDRTDPTTKKIILGVITGLGGFLSFVLLLGLLNVAGVWHPDHGMMPPESAPTDMQPASGNAPVQYPLSFDLSQPRPLRTYPPDPSSLPGLLAYWSFDEEKSGDVVRRGCKTVPGVRGSAVWISGPTDSIELGGGPALNFAEHTAFTFTGWVRTTTSGIVLSLRHSIDGGADIMLSIEQGGLSLLVREDRGEFGTPARVMSQPMADGNWHHFAAMRDMNGRIELYLDAKLVGMAATQQSGGSITTDLRFIGREERRIRTSFAGASTWNGIVDELAVFNRTLTNVEIAKLVGK